MFQDGSVRNLAPASRVYRSRRSEYTSYLDPVHGRTGANDSRTPTANKTHADPHAGQGTRKRKPRLARTTAPKRLPLNNFKHCLTLFSKFFSSFPHGTCSLSVSRPYLALDGIYHPLRAAFPNNPTRRKRLVKRVPDSRRGSHPQRRVLPDDFGSGTRRERPYRLQFGRPRAARFSIWALPASLAVTGGILVSFLSSA